MNRGMDRLGCNDSGPMAAKLDTAICMVCVRDTSDGRAAL